MQKLMKLMSVGTSPIGCRAPGGPRAAPRAGERQQRYLYQSKRPWAKRTRASGRPAASARETALRATDGGLVAHFGPVRVDKSQLDCY